MNKATQKTLNFITKRIKDEIYFAVKNWCVDTDLIDDTIKEISVEEIQKYIKEHLQLDDVLTGISKNIFVDITSEIEYKAREKIREAKEKERQAKQNLKIALQEEYYAKQELEKKLFAKELSAAQKNKLKKLFKVKFPQS